tara:strand:+ start:549 stop:803 length:255 start_codon:yes stop_codon:yes gene_type:complete
MSNVIDMNKHKSWKKTKDVETNGPHMQIIVGEDHEQGILVFVRQIDVEGTTSHKRQIVLDVEMLHTLIEGLYEAAEAIEKDQNK